MTNNNHNEDDISIAIVVAVAQNGVIGFDGDMPWKLSTDLRRFKQITLDKVVVMGRKTFEAIGKKPLPQRRNIVVTRNQEWKQNDVIVVDSLDNAIQKAKEISKEINQNEICIIGGGEIYRQSMEVANTLYVTHVHAKPKGDTKFGDIDSNVFECTKTEEIPKSPKDEVETSYCVYKRNV